MGLAAAYQPRHPDQTLLYQVIAEHLETFLVRQQERDRPVPGFVEREFRSFLECGILAHGFLRVHCDACGQDRLVPFSCKGRGFCPSCGGRRMTDSAAHLVDRVFPEAPVRQWVLSLPFALRYRLAYDKSLVRDVLQIFARAVFSTSRRRAREQDGIREGQCGAVTFVQRFGGSLNLNVHFHMLALDGVYAADATGHPRFHPLPPPDDAEVARLAGGVARRIASLLQRRCLGPDADPDEVDSLTDLQPGLASLYGASVAGRIATGPDAGRRISIAGVRIDQEPRQLLTGPPCATVSGFSLHANVAIPAADRPRLERICRYAARPPLAIERLSEPLDPRLAYRLKRPWSNGTTHIILDPLELIAKLAALVPPPRFHMVRYHGVLAPAAKWRPLIVGTAPEHRAAAALCPHHPAATPPAPPPTLRPRHYSIQYMGLSSCVACSRFTFWSAPGRAAPVRGFNLRVRAGRHPIRGSHPQDSRLSRPSLPCSPHRARAPRPRRTGMGLSS